MSVDAGAAKWARTTFGDAELGDARRSERLVALATDLARAAGASPAKASADSAALEGAYRFLRNDAVKPRAISEAGFEATARDVAAALAAGKTLLAVEDTTTLSYDHKVVEDQGLGDLGGPKSSSKRGFFVHSALLLDAQTGETVGLADQEYWARPHKKRGQRHQRMKRRYEEKESFKWQRTSERLREVLGDDAMKATISVCDREADVYEYLQHKVQHRERFVVRASWDRGLVVESGNQPKRLFEALAQATRYGVMMVELPQKGGRSARTAELTIRAMSVRLRSPERAGNTTLSQYMEVGAVIVSEEAPGVKDQQRLKWMLLTSEPIGTHEEIERVVRWYRYRWRIEEFHKAWKSGAGVEERRLQSADNLLRMASILAFVAVRLLQLRELAERTPDGPCDVMLAEDHWKVLWIAIEKKSPPRKPPTLVWAFRALGRLGGWKNTKNTGRISWATIWDGWFKLQERLIGFRIALEMSAGSHR